MALTGVLIIASFAIGIVTGILQRLTDEALAGLPIGQLGIQVIGLVVPVLLIFAALWTIYRIVPNRPVGWREVLPGAIVGTILWTLLRFGFTWYATSIARYDSFYGPLAAGISLLVFLYFAKLRHPHRCRGGPRQRALGRVLDQRGRGATGRRRARDATTPACPAGRPASGLGRRRSNRRRGHRAHHQASEY